MGSVRLLVAGAFALLFGTVSAQANSCVQVSDVIFTGSDFTFVVEAGKACRATYAVITIEFNAIVVDATVDHDDGQASFADNTVVCVVPHLEANPTRFTVVLDTCGETEGADIVATWSYVDVQGNRPDETALDNTGVVPTICSECVGPPASDFLC